MSEGRWLDEEEARAWRSLQRMHLRLNAALGHDLAAHSELSQQDYIVLVVLTERPEGALRLFELGHELGWEKSRVSHQVTRMAARGLVEKFVCSSDRRGQLVRVTEQGRNDIAAAAPSHVSAVRRFFVDRLSRDQLGQVAAAAEGVLQGLEEVCPEAAEAWG
ncbi:MAG TPA: MarR family winged helix-turn-helix transcriptional regulator [Acidimicrobiales bacterium]|nr:MarR family winged helix-turn-helix transcriptional regulator [Acidimicrobiales bacterium]